MHTKSIFSLSTALCFFVLLPSLASSQTPSSRSYTENTFGEGALVDAQPAESDARREQIRSQLEQRSIPVTSIIDNLLQDIKQSPGLAYTQGTTVFSSDGCPQAYPAESYFLSRVTPAEGISQAFIPNTLVNISGVIQVRGNRSACLTLPAAKALESMVNAMKLENLSLVVTSAYRSAGQQASLYNLYAPRYNTGAYKRVAQPGHSEHQLGTAVDLAGNSLTYMSGVTFAQSPEYQWLQENAQRFGFTASYKYGKESMTGYQYEPWHWRYVGEQAATILGSFDHSLSHSQEYQSPSFVFRALVDIIEKATTLDWAVGG